MPGDQLLGRLVTGAGQGALFTQLDWVRRQFLEKLGIEPFPGTLNLLVDDPRSLRVWDRLRRTSGVRIENPGQGLHECHARCYPASLDERIDAAIVHPEITGYPPAQIELIAAVRVRDALGLGDGALLRVEIRQDTADSGH
jgi:CTP-dependent riboflavin kinase